ncbi:MAG TPA: hypothetical protein VGP17_00875 [Solirubrobacteraceae bacterium]|nr:hypothetical protein [Solirubrobacteraceae bacterium]
MLRSACRDACQQATQLDRLRDALAGCAFSQLPAQIISADIAVWAGGRAEHKLLAHRTQKPLQRCDAGRGLSQLDSTDLGLAGACTSSEGLLIELMPASSVGEQVSGLIHIYTISDVGAQWLRCAHYR